MRLSPILSLAAIAALTVTGLAQHGYDMQWSSSQRHYTPWHENFCSLRVVDVYHPNSDQPLHFKIQNTSHTRLRYRLAVQVRRGNSVLGTGSVFVDNANPGEISDAQTGAFRGSLSGTTINLSVQSCSQPN